MKSDIRLCTAHLPRRTRFAQRPWCPSPGWTPCHAVRDVQARRAVALPPVRTQAIPPDDRNTGKLRALSRSRRFAIHELAQFEAELVLLMASIGLPPQDLTVFPTLPPHVSRAKRRLLKDLQIACRDIKEELAGIEADLIAEWDNICAATPA